MNSEEERMKFMWILAVASLMFFAPACGDDADGDGGGGGGGGAEAAQSYYDAVNECTVAAGGEEIDYADAVSGYDTTCDYCDCDAFFECMTGNLPADCAADMTYGTETCTCEI
jgi:hypothetical protein